VLLEADFTVPAGKLTTIIGPNGSGKSTLLYLVAGLLDVESGDLEVFGGRAGGQRNRVSLVLQSTEVSDRLPLTAREAVRMGRFGLRGMVGLPRLGERRRDRDAVRSAMERMDVVDLADRQINELSGGQRQRVFVAQGLAPRADLLLLDEPVTGLDVVSRQRILDAIAEECVRGATVVMTTHDLDDAAAADHVLLVSGGTVVSGAPGEVLVPDVLRAAYGGHLLVVGPNAEVVMDDPHHHREPSDATVPRSPRSPRP
jgi:manganese transport system ATP-binding protein